MIEKMKKLSLVIYHSSKDMFLENLQNLGVVHLEANNSIQNDDILDLNEKIKDLKKCEKLLKTISSSLKVKLKQKKLNRNIEELLEKIETEDEKLNKIQIDLENVNKEISLLSAWGNFDPDNIKKLNEIGINIKYFSCPSSNFNKMDKENLNIEIINKVKGTIYFVVVYREGEDIREIDATEQRIPLKNLNALYRESEKIEERIQKQQKVMADYTKYLDVIEEHILKHQDKLEYNIASASLVQEAEGKVLIINGWVPIRLLKQVENFLQKEDVVHITEAPTEKDNVPIQLKNGPFSRLFEPITKMHSLPAYTEIDPTPFFAPFFAAFFGLCLADTGYGLVLFLSIIASFVFIKNKNLRPILLLGIVLSITTMIGGLILNTFFGVKFTEISLIPDTMRRFIVLDNMNDAMSFAIMLGVIQVLLGFFMQMMNRIRIYGITGGLQPLGTMFILSAIIIYGVIYLMKGDFSIGPLPVKKILFLIPNSKVVSLVLMVLGLTFVLFFNNVKKSIFIRPLLGLWEIYGLITGVPGDILSYIRLFALGLASGLLGGAFNQIAFMVKDNSPFIIGYIGMILILLVGHGLNLALASLSAFVHPLRLTLLEFYKAVDFTGGGLAYSPFKNRIIVKK